MLIGFPKLLNDYLSILRVALEYSAHGEERMVDEAEFAETMETPLLGNKGSTSYLDQLCLQLKKTISISFCFISVSSCCTS